MQFCIQKLFPENELAKKEIHCGGIDLTSRTNPVINQKKIQGCGLNPGIYTLVADIAGEKTSHSMRFRVAGKDPASLPEKTRKSVAELSVTGRMIEMSLDNARTGYGILDIQGRVIAKGILQSHVIEIMPTVGTYLVKMGDETRKGTIR